MLKVGVMVSRWNQFTGHIIDGVHSGELQMLSWLISNKKDA